ncbi:MAG: carbonic anhydrase [Gemmatales bacterium]|nr:MAG: carbonic anhydrase [Gemmatales bacterium]
MQKLLHGLHKFREHVFSSDRELFESLKAGQQPEALFITCSDSRVDPNLFLQAKPGDLFVLRNAGNLVPVYEESNGGVGATIEYAVVVLNVQHIVVCGHSHCGAMQGLLNPETLQNLPLVRKWLKHAETTRRLVEEKYNQLEGEARLATTIQENVLVQLENLRTYPYVAERLEKGSLKLHGWVYKFETGDVFCYDPADGQFKPLVSPAQV